jgi:divalent metal cation (Fe/Co/Zn/Cd) transporter
VDLHVWFRGSTPLVEAHRLSHVVKDRLMQAYPQIVDAVIHIEPPPSEIQSTLASRQSQSTDSRQSRSAVDSPRS